jgi:cytochrome c
MKLRYGVALLGTALCLTASGTAFGTEDLEKLKEKLLNEQCNLCHSSKRIYNIDPAQIATVVERMRKMNPDWFMDIKSEHMVQAIAAITKEPTMISARKAWLEAVDRGELLFADTGLGKNGYSCKSCHDSSAKPPDFPITLRNVADAFPQWNPKLKRFVDLNETINRMIADKLGGSQLSPNDQKLFDLIAYLKTLK